MKVFRTAVVLTLSLFPAAPALADTPIIPGFAGRVSPSNIGNQMFREFLARNHDGPVFLSLHVEQDYLMDQNIDTGKLCESSNAMSAKRLYVPGTTKPDKHGIDNFYLPLPAIAISLRPGEAKPDNIYDLMNDPRVMGSKPGQGPKAGSIDCSVTAVFHASESAIDTDGHATSTVLYKVEGVFEVKSSFLGGAFLYDLRWIDASPEWRGALAKAYPDSDP